MLEGRSQPKDFPAGMPEKPAMVGPRLRCDDGSELHVRDGHTAVMAILNLTPDSFSDGGLYLDPAIAVRRAEELVAEGADILDLGAESTRPGATPVSPDEQWTRLSAVLPGIFRARLKVVLSVDTRHVAVAAAAAAAGIGLLNLPFPQDLLEQGLLPKEVQALLRQFDGVVLMHSRGTPQTMSQQTQYDGDLCLSVAAELNRTASRLLGEDPALLRRAIFDPGLGFAKIAAQSLSLLGQTDRLRRLVGGPVLIGASRKSFLGRLGGRAAPGTLVPPAQRLVPSVTAAVLAALGGAAVVRVHDVAATRAALSVLSAVREAARE